MLSASHRTRVWRSFIGRSRVQAIYGTRSTLFKREILGQIVGESENAAFNPAKLKRWFDKPALDSLTNIVEQTIFIAIDPNGGAAASNGPGSDTAIVSFVVTEGKVVVSGSPFILAHIPSFAHSCVHVTPQIVGLESHPTQQPEQPRHMLYAHIDALRAQPCFARCRFSLIAEANYGNTKDTPWFFSSANCYRQAIRHNCWRAFCCVAPRRAGVMPM